MLPELCVWATLNRAWGHEQNKVKVSEHLTFNFAKPTSTRFLESVSLTRIPCFLSNYEQLPLFPNKTKSYVDVIFVFYRCCIKLPQTNYTKLLFYSCVGQKSNTSLIGLNQPLPITCITAWAPPLVRSVAALDSHRSMNPTVNRAHKGSRLHVPYENLMPDDLRWTFGCHCLPSPPDGTI